MKFGFVIDNSSCIGCHACTTACKSENQVPVGVNRTWVKYVETGQYPDARRSFQVTRCNHCANPPCVTICPTAAMNQRDDGIVDFNSDACIGCKACMQACPYDAIYLDPETLTAAKCNFCAHRVELELEPACVVVCPEHAIIAGDMDDPKSEISKTLAKNNVTVRKPEQGTAPKLFYIDGNELALHPTALEQGTSFMFAEVQKPHGYEGSDEPRQKSSQGLPAGGPIQVGGSMAEHMVQVAYNAQHKAPWHWPIPAYLITKHIAGGSFALLALLAIGGGDLFSPEMMVWAGGIGLLMLGVTLGLLVYDLDRPDRFLYLLTRPQWRSWVARAAWVLTGFSMVGGLWWAAETAAWLGLWSMPASLRLVLAVLCLPLAIVTAVYTAFLFAQAQGRDFWQSAHLPLQMGLHALAFGMLTLMSVSELLGHSAINISFGENLTLLLFGASLVVTIVGDQWVPQATEVARATAHRMVHGPYRRLYWFGGIALGHFLPLFLMGIPGVYTSLGALFAASTGLFFYNYTLVMAPQDIPNS
jgi:Fe-S-cluster-containing dehydrogenase component/formate-dependent nitrite reductase membrane component NrfD